MDNCKITLFFEVCRLCLDKPGEFNIFKTKDLRKHIFSSIGLKVDSSKDLPQKICTKCLDIIINAKELKELALKNDSHMKSLFDTESDEVMNESIESTEDIISISSDKNTEKSSSYDDKTKEKKLHRTKEPLSQSNSTKIAVRKDLFETAIVSSSTKERRLSKDHQTSSTKKRESSKEMETEAEVDTKPKKLKQENQEEPYSVVKYKRIEVENSDAVKFECGVCKKQFDTWKKFYLHQRSHNKNRTCPLDMCGKKFTTKGDLEKHIRTHTGEKPFQCTICNKSFTQRVTLKLHTETLHCNVV